ncbi:MAG: YigZ family protein [Lachnospiraceae bacterium]|nr:YigZ family protein [Lachnospiraceae bacterium]
MEKQEIFLPVKITVEGGTGEIVEKKSKFIANVAAVETVEQATEFIDSMKKKYWDARHNCSAFVLGEHNEITRCSDDGEPSGTAGRPMLEVLLGQGLHNTVVVVTRYFGGVLLGTGGLVRAYTKAVQEGLANSRIATQVYGCEVYLESDYNNIGKIQYILGKAGITEYQSEFTEIVKITAFLLQENKEEILKEIIQATAARCKITEGNSEYRLLE